jgi:predicted lactoylglutathione lyase
MPVVQYIWNHKIMDGYGHSFADLDGHWEIMYMDENAIPL